jgi:uncharacterized protein (TIRG00374 family)
MRQVLSTGGTRRKKWRRAFRWGIALLVAGVACWLSIRGIQWAAVQQILASSSIALLLVALGTVLVTTLAKVARWHVLLRPTGLEAGRMRLLRVLLIGQLANSFLPARLGDALRAVILGPTATGGALAVLGTIVVEKALDASVGLVLLLVLAFAAPLPAALRGPVLVLAAVTASGLAIMVLAAQRREPARNLFEWATQWMPKPARQRLEGWLAALAQGLSLLRSPADALQALFWSAVVWALAVLTNYAILAALDIAAPGWSAWLVLVTVYVANFLPAIPAQVGLFEYACVLALTAAGVEPEPALAFGLVLHVVVYALPAVLGTTSVAIEGIGWNSLRQGYGYQLGDEPIES